MSPSESPAGLVASAMRTYPKWLVVRPAMSPCSCRGSRPDGKDGADGVFAAALPDGRAVALKISDGANRARPPVMKAALQALGVDISAVDPRAFSSPIFGHGKPVGEVRSYSSGHRF